MQAEMSDLHFRLNSVAERVRQFKEGGGGQRIPDAFKAELAKLANEGVSFANIRKATGIQKVVFAPFLDLGMPEANNSRPFRILNVREKPEKPSIVGNEVQVIFSYHGGKVTAQIAASGLTTDLLRTLTSC